VPSTTAIVEVTSEAELRGLLGAPNRRAATKVRRVLHERDREWLAASPFCLIGTSAADGSCDVSPKGDPPGFTMVLGESTIAIPDRAGNNRADGFINLLSNPQAGLLYLVPGRPDTLRINGRARLLSDAPFFDDMIVKGHRPKLALLVEIDEVFYHCPKAFMRANLWDPATWNPTAVPSTARIVTSVQADTEETVEELERHYGPSYADRLYPSSPS
jgi:PPOX class probable FMN-dependent enzyme